MLSGLTLMLQMGCFLNNQHKNILYTGGYFDMWVCFQLWPTCLKIFGEPWSDNKGSAQRGISKLRLMCWLILVEVYKIDMLCCGINKWKGEVPWFLLFTCGTASEWSYNVISDETSPFQEETVSSAWFCNRCLQDPC